ncbi:hypothetical protein PVAP13_4NG165508 [Panicum virgatum]|uniref:Uncharacterized protein n=1 Tax=Panicum virgatum TaxID=38727 RepID=A0A8T0T2P3_PANVG|nr:hypothetical protein PVAP13_4NG165508 [Panicum virgatum]
MPLRRLRARSWRRRRKRWKRGVPDAVREKVGGRGGGRQSRWGERRWRGGPAATVTAAAWRRRRQRRWPRGEKGSPPVAVRGRGGGAAATVAASGRGLEEERRRGRRRRRC